MPGVKALRKIQIGKETTSGSSVAATVVYRGEGTIKDTRAIEFTPEDVGYISGQDRTIITRTGGELTHTDTASFEQICYPLSSGVLAVTSGSADGTAAKVYDYIFPTTGSAAFNTYTIESGDDQQEEESAAWVCTGIQLSGKAGEALKISDTWMGRGPAPSTYTVLSGSAASPTAEGIPFSKGKIYIDDVSGTWGSTQVSSTLVGMSLDIKTGMVQVWTADGSLDSTFIKRVQPEVVLSLTFEHNASAVTEKAAWRAETARKIRIEFTGTALSGSTFTAKTLRIDLAGKWETFEALADENGNNVVTGTFRARYNSTAALMGRIVSVHGIAALT